MAVLVIASSADADHAEIIADLVTKADWRTAAKYDELFEKLYDRLADHPLTPSHAWSEHSHRRCHAVHRPLRDNEDNGSVTVLRIVHGRRRITGRMLGST